MDNKSQIKTVTEILEDKKAEDIIVFDMSERQSVSDFIVICTANTKVHMRAIRNSLSKLLREKAIDKIAESGLLESNWIIMDYGDFLVHLLGKDERTFYSLEELWKDASVVYH